MTSNQTLARPPLVRSPWQAPWTWLAKTLRSALQRRARMQLERHAVQTLSQLDDYQLMDIGLTRGDIRAAVSGRLADRITTPRRPRFDAAPVSRPTSACGSAS
jgi:uncharacterized protein YjiS (DUF1127 family)